MRSEKRAVPDTSSHLTGTSVPAVVGICLGGLFLVVVVVVVGWLVARRRASRRNQKLFSKQFLLPKDVKPVVSFKSAAGPGGLKKSPSPVQSPEYPERLFEEKRRGFPGVASSPSGDAAHPGGAGGCRSCDAAGAQEIRMDPVPMGTREVLLESGTLGRGGAPGGPAGTPLGSRPSEPNNNVPKSGGPRLEFSLSYNFERSALGVRILGAADLPPRTVNGDRDEEEETFLDPYVKLQLLPEKRHKVKTRVVRHTLHPVYDEDFTFYGISYNQLQSTTLHFAVIGFDRYSRDEIIGEVVCPLRDVDLSQADKETCLSVDLVEKGLKFGNCQQRGEVLVSICHQPATNQVNVVALKARNLPKFDVTGLADPYIKVYMTLDGQRVEKKKTHVKKRTLDPVFNETFTFDLPETTNPLEKIGFEFLVMDWDRVTKNEVMGRMEVSAKGRSPTGRSQWEEVMKNPRKQIAEWHRLRP